MNYLTQAGVLGVGALVSILLCRKGSSKKDSKEKVLYPLNKDKTETLPHRSEKAIKNLYDYYYDGVKSVYETFAKSAKLYAERDCQGARKTIKIHKENVNGKTIDIPEFEEIKWTNYKTTHDNVIAIGDGIIAFTGIDSKSVFGIYEETRPEWVQTYFGLARHGIPLATCYANLGIEALVHVINECELVGLVCNASSIKTLDSLKSKCKSLKYLICCDTITESSKEYKIISFDDCITLGKLNPIQALNSPSADDTCIIMYTSGSTGDPKGVMISHLNLISFATAVLDYTGICKDHVYLGYLPLAHVLELAAETSFYFAGGAIGYGNPRTLTDKGAKPVGDIKAVRPTHLAGVPRVYETIRKGILERIAGSGFITRYLFDSAYNAKVEAIKNGDDTPIWNRIVFSKMHEQLGGRLMKCISGGAPLNPLTQTFIGTLGTVIMQGYGLTETTGGCTIQSPHMSEFSTGNVGPVVASCEVKLISADELGYKVTDPDPRGEVCIRGNNVTKGYYKNPEKTKEVFTEDGWFMTGDIGRLNPDGTLSIIDRRKNLIKLSQGEYVALENLEMNYGTSKFIAPNGMCIYGDSFEEYVVAVIIPQKTYVLTWAQEKGIKGEYSDILKSKELYAALKNDFDTIAFEQKKKSFEKVNVFRVVDDEWTPENGCLTAAMKLQRGNINKKYRSIIDELYKKK